MTDITPYWETDFKMKCRNDTWRFDENKRASEATIEKQLEYARGEVEELASAIYSGEDEIHILEECWDVIQSIEGVMRKYPQRLVDAVYLSVIEKCKARGDYDN